MTHLVEFTKKEIVQITAMCVVGATSSKKAAEDLNHLLPKLGAYMQEIDDYEASEHESDY